VSNCLHDIDHLLKQAYIKRSLHYGKQYHFWYLGANRDISSGVCLAVILIQTEDSPSLQDMSVCGDQRDKIPQFQAGAIYWHFQSPDPSEKLDLFSQLLKPDEKM
jgi:hypothetical protein